MKDSKIMENVFKKSVHEIELVLDEKRPITDITKVAAGAISNYAKMKQTECHEHALTLAEKKFRMNGTNLIEK